MIQALPRAAAIRAVMENSWFGYPNSVLRGACFISITDNDTVADPDDLAYAQWSGSDWVHSSRVRDFFADLGFSTVISHRFDDVTQSDDGCLMTGDQAASIVDVISKCSSVFVHCAAGISRSGAIAEFAHRHHDTDRSSFVKMNPHIRPNPYVLDLLLRESGLRTRRESDFKDLFF